MYAARQAESFGANADWIMGIDSFFRYEKLELCGKMVHALSFIIRGFCR
jgi:hypothetical protein